MVTTPIDLSRLVKVRMPSVRATYRLEEVGTSTIENALRQKGIL